MWSRDFADNRKSSSPFSTVHNGNTRTVMRSIASKSKTVPRFCSGKLFSSKVDEVTSVLTEELRLMRKDISLELKKPAFVVFTNKAMDEIVRVVPQSNDEIENLTYAGNKIMKSVYPEILKITAKFAGSDSTFSKVESAQKKKQGVELDQAAATESEETDELVESESKEILLSDLSPEQQGAALKALSGMNIFITGSAGTGKSYLLKYIVQESKKKFNDLNSVVVTAPTGVAAVNVGGMTVNAFAGYGLGKQLSCAAPSDGRDGSFAKLQNVCVASTSDKRTIISIFRQRSQRSLT